jgi:hypothetical protein
MSRPGIPGVLVSSDLLLRFLRPIACKGFSDSAGLKDQALQALRTAATGAVSATVATCFGGIL